MASSLDKAVNNLVDRILKAQIKARDTVLDEVIKDTDEYVPYYSGKLSKSVHKLPKAKGIIYTAPYAKYAFEPVAPSGKRKEYNKSKHPKAQGYPLKKSKEVNLEKWKKLYLEEILKNV